MRETRRNTLDATLGFGDIVLEALGGIACGLGVGDQSVFELLDIACQIVLLLTEFRKLLLVRGAVERDLVEFLGVVGHRQLKLLDVAIVGHVGVAADSGEALFGLLRLRVEVGDKGLLVLAGSEELGRIGFELLVRATLLRELCDLGHAGKLFAHAGAGKLKVLQFK